MGTWLNSRLPIIDHREFGSTALAQGAGERKQQQQLLVAMFGMLPAVEYHLYYIAKCVVYILYK